MAKANKREIIGRLALLVLGLGLFLGGGTAAGEGVSPAAPPASAPAAAAAPAAADPLQELLAQPFAYLRENRTDPFVPFVTEITVKAPVEEEVGELTGMRQFEPGQLNLVAILFSQDRQVAMVEDSLGKGYLIHQGTLLGRNGVVAEIKPNSVVISQSVLSTGDTKRTVTVEMVLRKEGDKQR